MLEASFRVTANRRAIPVGSKEFLLNIARINFNFPSLDFSRLFGLSIVDIAACDEVERKKSPLRTYSKKSRSDGTTKKMSSLVLADLILLTLS
jgi:hypothetical protein